MEVKSRVEIVYCAPVRGRGMIDGDTSKQAKINNPSQMIYVHNAAGRNPKVAVAQV